jgi:hypothetical protein
MRLIGMLVVLNGIGGSLAAQSPPTGDLGRRVWVREMAENGKYNSGVKGTLQGMAGDTLFVRPANGAATFALAPREGRKLFYYSGQRSSVGRGALIGTGLGVASGAILGFASGEDCSGDEWLCFDRGTMAAAGALTLGAGGLVVGLIVGAMSPHEVWTSAEPARVRPVVATSSRGVNVGMSLRF